MRGIEGDDGHVTAEAEWKKSIVTPGGMVMSPLLAMRGDAAYANMTFQLGRGDRGPGGDARRGNRHHVGGYYRYMTTAGLEWRWPVLFTSINSSHVIEPMAQVFARPDEQHIGGLGIPNEDAQSFVFDASSLFERDKFSGFDRMEGGTRVNIGLRYSGVYSNGFTTNAILGQSYQVGGENSFAAPDLVNVGAYSGLETPTSDYVGLFGLTTPRRHFGLGQRAPRRAELRAAPRRAQGGLEGQSGFADGQFLLHPGAATVRLPR